MLELTCCGKQPCQTDGMLSLWNWDKNEFAQDPAWDATLNSVSAPYTARVSASSPSPEIREHKRPGFPQPGTRNSQVGIYPSSMR